MSVFSLNRRSFSQLGLASLMASTGLPALAQTWPQKTTRIVLGFAPGGPLDVVTRLLAAELTKTLGQAFVVENKSGASGQIATDLVAAAPADGHTLLSTASTFIVNPLLSQRKQANPLTDFVGISQIARLPTILVVPRDFPANTLAEFQALAKTRTLTYSSAGNGGPGHLAGALLSQTLQSPMIHAPFRGAAPALMEVIAGRIDFSFYTMTGLKEHVASGLIKPLAITAETRHHLFPDVPTMGESGVPGFEHVGAWFGLVAPAATPADVQQKLNQAVVKIIAQKSFQDMLELQGVIPVGSSASAFQRFLEQDSARWSKLIKDAGIQAQ